MLVRIVLFRLIEVLPSAKLFTDLDKLKKGDYFYLHVYDKVLAYQVDNIAIVEPNDYGLLEIEKGRFILLFTCTPYGINTHRLLVLARTSCREYDG